MGEKPSIKQYNIVQYRKGIGRKKYENIEAKQKSDRHLSTLFVKTPEAYKLV